MTKKCILSIIVLVSISLVQAQNVVFKDRRFKEFLLSIKTINSNQDTEISIDEALSTTALRLAPSVAISDLTGLESFTNLKKLILNRMYISHIDLSKLSKLIYLDLSDNPLDDLDLKSTPHIDTLFCSFSNLWQIDLSGLSGLKFAEFHFTNLTSIDVSHNLELTHLMLYRSKLTDIDVSKNKALRFLDFGFNMISHIDVSQNSQLGFLNCETNALQTLDISHNQKLGILICGGNPLGQLDISKNPELVDLRCGANGLTTLDISQQPNLLSLFCSGNSLELLDLSQNPLLNHLYCSENNLKSLDVSKQTMERLSCESNPKLSNICIRTFADLYRGDFVKDAQASWTVCTSDQEACDNHITNTSACDNFRDSDLSTPQIEEYAIPTDQTRWQNGAPVPDEKAYKGLFWTEATDHNGFSAEKSRMGDGILRYSITQPKDSYEPFLLVLGSYAQELQERKFSLDLRKNSIVSFELKNAGDTIISFYVQLEDIHGNSLVFDKYYEYGTFESYYYQIGYALFSAFNSYWSDEQFMNPKGKSKFAYDFSNGVCGLTETQIDNKGKPVLVNVPKPDIAFDYEHVSMVKFFVSGFAGDFVDSDLIKHPIEISDFKIGGISIINGITKETPLSADQELYTVYDVLGNRVAQGKESDLQLERGRLYILKSDTRVKKKMWVD